MVLEHVCTNQYHLHKYLHSLILLCTYCCLELQYVIDLNTQGGLSFFFPLLKVMLQVLYKLKTAKVFERARGKEEKPSADIVEEDPFAIQTLSWCPESRMLCVAGVSAHVIAYRFSKQEVTTEEVQVGQTLVLLYFL